MKKYGLRLGLGITAFLIIILFSPLCQADDISWADPITLDIDYHNKNKWVAEADIQIGGDYFDTMAFLFFTDESPPSTVAEIQIRGLMGKEYVNITQNITNTRAWNVVYLSNPIFINGTDNYTVRVTIKSNGDILYEDSIIVGTRSDDPVDNGILDYSLFKIGTSGIDELTIQPEYPTEAPSQSITSDYEPPSLPDESSSPNINYWAILGISLIIFSITGITIFKIPSILWFLSGLVTLLISLGVA